MAEFTKGKWIWDGCKHSMQINSDSKPSVYIASVYYCSASEDEDFANARLIAAAPEMYNKLYDAFQFMKAKSCCDGDEFDSHAKSILKLLNRIDGKTSKGGEIECRDLKI